jgi:hypothetical protein
MQRKAKRMGYTKRQPKYRWRDYLTDEEEKRIAQIEESQRPTPAMRVDWITIRNRASQRALRDAAKRSA